MIFQNVLYIVFTVQFSLGFGYFEKYHKNKDNDVDNNSSVLHKNCVRYEMMDKNGLYYLKWWINENQKNVYFEVIAHTRGFAGLGFSTDSRNARADIVLLWVDDTTGQPNALDCHGEQYPLIGLPLQDDTQNYYVIDGYQNATHTKIKFKRKVETCDPFDIPITADTFKIFWSIGDNDPIHGKLTWHGQKRGVKTLHLFSSLFTKNSCSPYSKTDMSDIQKWDITVSNVTIELTMDTLYWCKIVRLPDLTDKQHIIGYEALLSDSGEADRNIVHHMTLFECQSKLYPGSDLSSWDVWAKSFGTVCNSNLLTPRDWDSCSTPVAVWSLGSKGQFLPPHAGIPMGGKSGVNYYMIEIQYDNPNGKTFVDHSGFRIHYTHNLRTYDAGIIITGLSISDTQLIPPGQQIYRNVGMCGPSCSSMFPKDGIKIISGMLHSHQAGRKMSLRHVRSGKELKRIIFDENYNYKHHYIHEFANETVVLPGDYLITDCSYDTKHRKRPTFGGYSMKDEMCLAFITYYPKVELSGCYSMTPVREYFEMFGVYQFYSLNMTDVENLFLNNDEYINYNITNTMNRETIPIFGNNSKENVINQESLLNKLIISEPVEFHDRTFLSHLNQLPWYDPLFTKRVEQDFINGKHMTFCRVSNDSISIPTEIIRFPVFTTFVEPTTSCVNYIFTNNEVLRSRGSRHLNNFTISLLLVKICFQTINRQLYTDL